MLQIKMFYYQRLLRNFFQLCFFRCELMMYKLNTKSIFLHFQTTNMQLTIENFQEIIKPPFSNKYPSRVLEINKPPPRGVIENLRYYIFNCCAKRGFLIIFHFKEMNWVRADCAPAKKN